MIPLGVLGGARHVMWTPLDLPNLDLWLDADDLASVAIGDPISVWPDRSGNGYNGVQTVLAEQPLRTARGGFFGAGRKLLTGAPASNPARTIIAVAQSATSGTNRSIVHSESYHSFILELTTGWRMQARLWGSTYGTAAFPVWNSWDGRWTVLAARVLWDAIDGDETSAIFRDGSLMNTSFTQPNITSPSPSRTVQISRDWDGEISDVICTSSQLSDQDIANVSAYLMEKRGIV